jgi:hypothetical protein
MIAWIDAMSSWARLVGASIFALLGMICMLVIVGLLFGAGNKLRHGEAERYWVDKCDWPREVIARYLQIVETNPDGEIAGTLWKALQDRDLGRAEQLLEIVKEFEGEEYRQKLLSQINDNFGLTKPLSNGLGARIEHQIRVADANCSEYKRRQAFGERANDALRDIGLAAVLSVLTIVLAFVNSRWLLR